LYDKVKVCGVYILALVLIIKFLSQDSTVSKETNNVQHNKNNIVDWRHKHEKREVSFARQNARLNKYVSEKVISSRNLDKSITRWNVLANSRKHFDFYIVHINQTSI